MKRIVKIIFSGLIIGVILTIIDISLRYFSGGFIYLNENLLKMLRDYIIYSIPLSLVNSQFFDYLYRKEVWTKLARYKLIIGFVGSVVLTLITIFFVRVFINVVLEGESW